MSINFQVTPYGNKTTILEDNKYCLYGDPIEGNAPGKTPKLFFSLRGNYPHIRIKLNNGKQKEEGNVDLPLDLITMMSIVECLNQVANTRDPHTHVVGVKKAWWDKTNNRPGEPFIAAFIYIGRDNDGECFIGVQRGKSKESKDYLKMKFHFTPAEFHPILDAQTQQPLAKPQTSTIMARAWVRLLTQLLPMINANVWDYNITNEGKFALKQAGGNTGNQNGGYTQRSSAPAPAAEPGYGEMKAQQSEPKPEPSFDEDFPW